MSNELAVASSADALAVGPIGGSAGAGRAGRGGGTLRLG